MADRLLSVPEVERFVRRLVSERRITVVHVGRHVRIPESAVTGFIEAGTVLPIPDNPCQSIPYLRLVA